MKDIFSYNADVDKTAYLNWRTHRHDHIGNMIVLADGFMSSAILLAREALEDNSRKRADILIYPILFNSNHGIEVYLKSISWSLNILLGNTGEPFPKNHDLQGLLNEVKTLANDYISDQKRLDSFHERLEILEVYLNELYLKIEKLTPKGKVYNIDFSRYTMDIKKEPQFYINELDNVVVDLENFVLVFEEIHRNLENFSTHFVDLIDLQSEIHE